MPYKNFQAGIRAMTPLKDEYALSIVGSGLLKKEYELLASKLGVDLHIFYGSNDSMMHSLYSKASFLIHPSLFEGFGFIPAEAALHRKATILTTRSGVKELLVDEESSYFCDPTDVPLMQQRARHLADKPERSGCKWAVRPMIRSTTSAPANQSMAVWEELERWN